MKTNAKPTADYFRVQYDVVLLSAMKASDWHLSIPVTKWIVGEHGKVYHALDVLPCLHIVSRESPTFRYLVDAHLPPDEPA